MIYKQAFRRANILPLFALIILSTVGCTDSEPDVALVKENISAIRSAKEKEYFYCGMTKLDGSGQDYVKWGKGTDFTYNKSKDRWEWITEFTYQYIYPDGRYKQIARVSYFDDEKGMCNKEMESIYKKKMKEITGK